ncbi:Calcium/calmodulin dependent protein kinase II association-domain-containing protein [Dunaliella salina]|uniref:Calcium/calmodulin dependent protein kinase II association-domain-containing protein n=1 Tax=Dunaliella salina TaxID=3046 RepID=A0ABQ7GWT1_DUNSA|nr:Calcium/calmodulin dependent protein kinase II association-domain-containing protein [Dunaliella salina]KAF5839070.1 Calcium/calmodulin dependent protein kinase II association-domain-containing protein [Dunaliella salina]|eukprot:KAF5839069.1 Calcium/calmodulin dependent protein kinase II association-domain-containing protein [Dunaliella salina]
MTALLCSKLQGRAGLVSRFRLPHRAKARVIPPRSMPLTQEAKSALEKQLLNRQQVLLDAISAGDYETYTSLCDENITCFEPEAKSHLVQGLPFHKFYFDFGAKMATRAVPQPLQRELNTMSGASVRLLSDTSAVVAYVRLKQTAKHSPNVGHVPETIVSQETRVWQQFEDGWKNVHLHRSMMS